MTDGNLGDGRGLRRRTVSHGQQSPGTLAFRGHMSRSIFPFCFLLRLISSCLVSSSPVDHPGPSWIVHACPLLTPDLCLPSSRAATRLDKVGIKEETTKREKGKEKGGENPSVWTDRSSLAAAVRTGIDQRQEDGHVVMRTGKSV